MKFTVAKDVLVDALQKVSAGVAARSTMPVLQNFLFATGQGIVHLAATDLDLSIRATIPAAVDVPGATTLPSKLTPTIVREAPSAELTFELRDNEVTRIRAGSAVYQVRGISADDFPPLPSVGDGRPVSVDAGVLRNMLQKVSYAASTDETRRILTGTFLRFRNGRMTAVATDGKRLALVEQDWDAEAADALELVLPSKAVNELIRSIGDEGSVRIRTTANQAVFETDTLMICTKLVEGTYPNYSQVIPGPGPIRVSIERELFQSAVRRVAIMTSDKSNSVRLTFTRGRLAISASSPDMGDAEETLAVKYDGDEFSIAFNPTLLTDPLRYLVSDQVSLEMSTPTSPGLLKADEPFLYVIMPMMIA